MKNNFADSNEWKLLSGNQPKRGEILPPSRHSHSAVIYENEMFIYVNIYF